MFNISYGRCSILFLWVIIFIFLLDGVVARNRIGWKISVCRRQMVAESVLFCWRKNRPCMPKSSASFRQIVHVVYQACGSPHEEIVQTFPYLLILFSSNFHATADYVEQHRSNQLLIWRDFFVKKRWYSYDWRWDWSDGDFWFIR